MTHTHQLIEKVEFLLQLIVGTEAGESQTVVDICDLIGKIRKEDLFRDEIMEMYNKMLANPSVRDHLDRFNAAMSKINNVPLIELKNPKNPE